MTTGVGARPLPGAGASPGLAGLEYSTPYPWPYDWAFAGSRTALLVLTTDEPDPRGSDQARVGQVWPIIDALAAATTRAGGLVIDIQSRRPPRRGSRPGESPSAPPAAAAPHALSAPSGACAEHRIDAPGWDAFYGTPLDLLLRTTGRELVLFTGGWLEVGVHSTMRAANDRGYECLLVADACVSGSPLTAAAAVSSIEMSGGIFGAVGTSQDVLSLLDASHPCSAPHTSEPS